MNEGGAWSVWQKWMVLNVNIYERGRGVECVVKVDGLECQYMCENGVVMAKRRMSVSINICIKVGELLYGGLFWCCAIHAP